MSLRTPEQIAEEVTRHAPASAKRRALIVRAIEADRAQPEHDGTVHAAVIRALRDRGAVTAAQWVDDEPDLFWDRFAGPMLDEIEAAHQ